MQGHQLQTYRVKPSIPLSGHLIEKRDQEVIVEKILKHCNLWVEPKARDAPGIVQEGDVDFILDPQYIPMEEFLANHA